MIDTGSMSAAYAEWVFGDRVHAFFPEHGFCPLCCAELVGEAEAYVGRCVICLEDRRAERLDLVEVLPAPGPEEVGAT